ncbi:MAG: CDP-diacylglycerol--glycerol-3-phosphate 3-phosphatidyltransferase [Caulobacter sp.]|nr:CDP-diacylglycerol--glycerol-3-phosphate 3-phosphatidyltransferase [Caulobacter sp.]
MKHLPNLITGLRLVLTLVVFLAMLGLASQPFILWLVSKGADPQLVQTALYFTAFWGFAIAAVTDFFDGWLARKLGVESTLGAILDPIADKVLVAGAVVGLAVLGSWMVGLAGGLILFREFAVSALRETLAPKGLTLPVTLLAKWKTTLQLLALGAQLFVGGWIAWGLPRDPALAQKASMGADIVLWLAVVATIWTGVEYALAARRTLKA